MKGFVSTPYSITRLSEIISAKYLIWQLVKRDFTVRYKQTALGFIWAVINPLVSILLYFFVFGILVKLPTPEYQAPYAAVLMVGILLWNLFSGCMNSVSDSLINNMGIIKKIYFPRLILSLVSMTVSLIDFFISVIFFIPILYYMGIRFDVVTMLVYFPLCVMTTLLLAWGLGCFMAILKVKHKDFKHIVPLAMQMLFYASPIVYTQSIVPEQMKRLYEMNPLSGIISLGRYAFLNGGIKPSMGYYLSIAATITIVGTIYFLVNERKVVDLE